MRWVTLAHYQNRNSGVGQYLAGLATQQHRGEPLAAVGGHDNEVAAAGIGRLEDSVIGMIARLAHGLARHAGLLCTLAHELQVVLRARFGFLLDALLGYRVERAFVSDQQVIIGYYVDTG